LTNEDLQALEQLAGSNEAVTANGGLKNKVNIDELTKKAEAL
jgi:2-isopropylmalate synthase